MVSILNSVYCVSSCLQVAARHRGAEHAQLRARGRTVHAVRLLHHDEGAVQRVDARRVENPVCHLGDRK